jgi:hypothetical protein
MLIILLGTVQTQIYISTVNLQSFKYIDFYIISEENVTKIKIAEIEINEFIHLCINPAIENVE